MKSSIPRPCDLAVAATTAADLDLLESIIIKPAVMRGCFGSEQGPHHVRGILLREWQACQAGAHDVHLTISCLRRGHRVVAGAGYLLDAELRLFITPDMHGRGLGRALVQALRCEADHRHLPELRAWVYPENTASARLLESCGFLRGEAQQVASYDRPMLHYLLPLGGELAHTFGSAQPFCQAAR